MAFYVKCDGHECTEVAALTVKGQVFNPVNELPAGWRVVMWTAPAPEGDGEEMNPGRVALQGLVEAVKGANPIAGAGLSKMAGAMEIGQQLAAMKRVQIRRSCVCPGCAGKLVLGSAEVVGEVQPELPSFGFPPIPGIMGGV